jgi:flagellar motility protein MotE (MotC chaperone)
VAKFRIRLLPALMGALALMMTVKLGGLWQELSISVGSETAAQTQEQPAAADAQPAQDTQTAAQSAPEAAPAPAEAPGEQPQQTPPAAGATEAAIDPFSYTDEEVEVLQQLSKRRAELDARARQIDQRETLVTAAEQRMDQKMAELKAMQSTLQELLKKRSDAEEAQLQSLVKIYENMKPKAAAGVFEELDMDILLEVVGRMKERKVAPILAMMTPTKAKEVTFELAQRQQLPVAQ